MEALSGNYLSTKTSIEQSNLATSKLNALTHSFTGKGKISEEQATKSGNDFEEVFLSEMFNHVFSGIGTNSLFGGGKGEDMWKSLLVNEYARVTTLRGGVGIADTVKREMLKIQEQSHAGN